MATYITLYRERTPIERKWMSPSRDGDAAYKISTGWRGKLLGGAKLIAEGNGIDEGETWKYTIRVPNHFTLKEVRTYLRATYTRIAGCGHDYDCCGCANYRVSGVTRIERGQFSFRLSKSYNY